MYHIVVNPAAGAGKAPKFVSEHITPLLDALDISYDIHTTGDAADAARIGKAIQAEAVKHSETEIRVIAAGGDGTAHEMMEGILEQGGEHVGNWALVVLPLGTANALHASLFPPGSPPVEMPKFLDSLISDDPEVRHALSSLILALSGAKLDPLPVTQLRIHNPSDNTTSKRIVPSHIVLSTSLHAAILNDSEALRKTHPGLERFKMAAAANISVFFDANVRLLPSSKGVRQYDPHTRDWAPPFTTDSNLTGTSATEHTLNGPFTYFLTSSTTPRLEPTFVITPTLMTLPAEAGERTMDIVVLRPLRDPHVAAARQAGRDGGAEWATRAASALGAAYQGGKHVGLTYTPDGETEEAGPGPVVVEVFRCAGFVWTPTEGSHAKSHIMCADGSIETCPAEQEAHAMVMAAQEGNGFWVWG